MSLSRNFLVLIITDKTLKLFKETIDDISKKNMPKIIQEDVKKCFPELFKKK